MSPLVFMTTISIAAASRPCAAMRRSLSSRVWASAKGLPRVPSLKRRDLRDREGEGIGPFPYWFGWLYSLKINAAGSECQILPAGDPKERL